MANLLPHALETVDNERQAPRGGEPLEASFPSIVFDSHSKNLDLPHSVKQCNIPDLPYSQADTDVPIVADPYDSQAVTRSSGSQSSHTSVINVLHTHLGRPPG